MSEILLCVGDYIHYGAHGVCRVEGQEYMFMGAEKKKYYRLRPVGESQIDLYLPADADPERVRLRPVQSAEEIYALVQRELETPVGWENDSKARRELSGKTLRSGETAELIRMVKAIYRHWQELPQGKSLPVSESDQLRAAEKQLYSEFCFVLDIEKDQVIPFVLGEIQVPKREI